MNRLPHNTSELSVGSHPPKTGGGQNLTPCTNTFACTTSTAAFNDQMFVILQIAMDECEDKVELNLFGEALDAIECDYKTFHGLTPVVDGCENWARQECVQLLFGNVPIDQVFEQRAEEYIREVIVDLKAIAILRENPP